MKSPPPPPSRSSRIPRGDSRAAASTAATGPLLEEQEEDLFFDLRRRQRLLKEEEEEEGEGEEAGSSTRHSTASAREGGELCCRLSAASCRRRSGSTGLETRPSTLLEGEEDHASKRARWSLIPPAFSFLAEIVTQPAGAAAPSAASAGDENAAADAGTEMIPVAVAAVSPAPACSAPAKTGAREEEPERDLEGPQGSMFPTGHGCTLS